MKKAKNKHAYIERGRGGVDRNRNERIERNRFVTQNMSVVWEHLAFNVLQTHQHAPKSNAKMHDRYFRISLKYARDNNNTVNEMENWW